MFAELGVATASGQRQQPIPTQFNLELSSLQNYTVQMTRLSDTAIADKACTVFSL